MPYTPKEQRAKFELLIKQILEQKPDEGDLVQIICSLTRGALPDHYRFSDLNKIRGVLANATDDFVLHVIQPYEIIKRNENGDL